MPARFCTVEESSEDAARKAGARELGVPPEDTSVEKLAGGRFRVNVARAPSTLEVAVRKDDMEAFVTRITPALGDYPQPTREAVETALKELGVVAGLLGSEIDELVAVVAKGGIERKNVTVARGVLPRPGANANVVRHYLGSAEKGAGRRQLIVRDGEVLIEREPATLGETGQTVKGRMLPAARGVEERVRHGAGIAGDAEQLCWTASVPVFGYLEIDEAGGPRVVPAVTVSADHLGAHLDLRRPGAGEPPITRREVQAAIAACGVVHGVSAERIQAAWRTFEARGGLPEPALVAEGTPPRPGRDAGIAFEIEPDKIVGDRFEGVDRIDFRERRMVKNVRAGQRIGTWLPDGEGVSGRGVDGEPLPAPHGEPGDFTVRENVVTHELGGGRVAFEAAIDGMLLVEAENELAVVDFLEIASDVDYDTGNIDATGCVLVRGTVRGKFRVTAEHDITVQASVEDAIVAAGATLYVGEGIFGGPYGRVAAGSRISAKFAQNANVACGGDVEIRDSDTGSVIECRGRLLATRARGALRGGRYTALQGVKVRELGSALGAPTTVSVGSDPVLARELREVQDALRAVQERGRKLERTLSASASRAGAEQSPDARRHVKAKRALVSSETRLKARKRQLEEQLCAGVPPTVEVLGTVHAGVDIYIRGAHRRTERADERVRFSYDPETRDVRAGPLSADPAP